MLWMKDEVKLEYDVVGKLKFTKAQRYLQNNNCNNFFPL